MIFLFLLTDILNDVLFMYLVNNKGQNPVFVSYVFVDTHFNRFQYHLKFEIRIMIVILLGLPGCGKTTIGKYVADALGYKWIDVDDDILEPAWKCKVSEKLNELGSLKFIEEEGKVLLSAIKNFENDTVISLTGSNPLVENTMKALKVHPNFLKLFVKFV